MGFYHVRGMLKHVIREYHSTKPGFVASDNFERAFEQVVRERGVNGPENAREGRRFGVPRSRGFGIHAPAGPPEGGTPGLASARGVEKTCSIRRGLKDSGLWPQY
jgi:hypothetical protein